MTAAWLSGEPYPFPTSPDREDAPPPAPTVGDAGDRSGHEPALCPLTGPAPSLDPTRHGSRSIAFGEIPADLRLYDQKTLARLFARSVLTESGCFEWRSKKNVGGYGIIGVWVDGKAKTRSNHRLAWTILRGPVPDGLEFDHLCRNRPCWNPDHMELVTHKENCRRGINNKFTAETAAFGNKAAVAAQRAKTHCPRGHPYDESNTYVDKRGYRTCKTCQNERSTAWKRVKAAQRREARESTGVSPDDGLWPWERP